MKHLLRLTTIAAVLLVGCGPSVDIHQAAKDGNIEAIKQHLDAGGYVDAKNKKNIGTAFHGATLLHGAAENGHKEIAELLIAKGANVNARNRQGWTPLMVAAKRGKVDIAKLLMIKESDPNPHNKGWTSLHRAAYHNEVEIVAFLVEMGLDINAKDDQGQTPLHWPANYGKVQMVNYLISMGADVNPVATDGIFSGETPLDAAIKDNQDVVAVLLTKHGARTAEELEAIIDAAKKGDFDAVKQHLAAGTDVNIKNARGWTPLHLATDQGHKKVVEFLIAKGANVNAKDKKGRTTLDWAEEENKEIAYLLRKQGGKTGKELKKLEAVNESIHAAARYGNIEAVKKHLATGTDVSLRNENGDTPLNYAAFLGHVKIVELLLENGANVNAKGLADWTPLHLAAHSNNEQIVQLIITKGAEVNPHTSPGFGGTPLDVANGKVANLLRKHGGKTGEELKSQDQ